MVNLYDRFLPIYLRLFCGHWLALWCAPVRLRSFVTAEGSHSSGHFDHYWDALRITLRKGPSHSRLIRVIKKGVI